MRLKSHLLLTFAIQHHVYKLVQGCCLLQGSLKFISLSAGEASERRCDRTTIYQGRSTMSCFAGQYSVLICEYSEGSSGAPRQVSSEVADHTPLLVQGRLLFTGRGENSKICGGDFGRAADGCWAGAAICYSSQKDNLECLESCDSKLSVMASLLACELCRAL